MQSLNNLEKIRIEVERQTAQAIIPVLFDKLTHFHARNYWRSCACDYCITKRKATWVIANSHKDRKEYKFFYSEMLKKLIKK